MLVSIKLDDEEKYQVLLAAFFLFLLALLTSVCLAFACCPLNRWLLERHERARKRRQELAFQRHRALLQSHQTTSQQSYYGNYHSNMAAGGSGGNKSATLNSYMGPPPNYEVALRATRLQSLTGGAHCPLASAPSYQSAAAANESYDAEKAGGDSQPDWLETVLANQRCGEQAASERQLDLGDYFHAPKEPFAPANDFYLAQRQQQLASEHFVPGGGHLFARSSSPRPHAPPVMLRLWVKLLEPGELVERARASSSAGATAASASRKPLARQLSIPQLFGSLMTLASGGSGGGGGGVRSMAICDSKSASDEKQAGDEQRGQAGASKQEQQAPLSSMSSASSSDGGAGEQRERTSGAGCKRDQAHVGDEEGEDEERRMRVKRRRQEQQQQQQHFASVPSVSSITSRVLHMNVASFSYVRDENLISTKKHNQMNFHHFYAPTASAAASKADAKMCQLLVSICDIENLLSSSGVQQRACLRLAQNSSVYVKCEILAPKFAGAKSTATRLLRNPLRVITRQQQQQQQQAGPSPDSARSSSHTIDFASTLPAASIEPTPASLAHLPGHPQRLQMAQLEARAGGGGGGGGGGSSSLLSSFAPSSLYLGNDSTRPQQQQQQQQEQQQHDEQKGAQAGASEQQTRRIVNWRHEPSADGKSIVAFNSIPKQIAQQQELACSFSSSNVNTSASNSLASSSTLAHSAAGGSGASQCIDLIQFDSVFVSPILARSLLELGHIRMRVYAQCKYVNESCLAELKLPLKQLMRAQSRDNLGDALAPSLPPAKPPPASHPGSDAASQQASPPPPPQQHAAADLILNNLLANLVTASTGSPLSTLIEQISAEDHEAAAAEDASQADDTSEPAPATFKLSDWLASATSFKQHEPATGQLGSPGLGAANLQRASASLGAALNYLGEGATGQREAGGFLPAASGRAKLPLDDTSDLENSARRFLEGEQWAEHCDKLIEQNYCRALMVSHWLNYLVAPSYECQLVEEQRGQLVLGLTYLPTSNRLIFNAHKATLAADSDHLANDKQLIKKLRLQADTSYLLRFMMIANNRLIKRKQTACARKPEWDSQEPVTFDLVSVQVDQPTFIVALVMRNPHALACSTTGGSLQSLTSYHHQLGVDATPTSGHKSHHRSATPAPPFGCCQSDPESLRLANNNGGGGSGIYRAGGELWRQQQQQPAAHGRGKRDLVIGHVVLAQELWHELKAQPRRQLIKQLKLL